MIKDLSAETEHYKVEACRIIYLRTEHIGPPIGANSCFIHCRTPRLGCTNTKTPRMHHAPSCNYVTTTPAPSYHIERQIHMQLTHYTYIKNDHEIHPISILNVVLPNRLGSYLCLISTQRCSASAFEHRAFTSASIAQCLSRGEKETAPRQDSSNPRTTDNHMCTNVCKQCMGMKKRQQPKFTSASPPLQFDRVS